MYNASHNPLFVFGLGGLGAGQEFFATISKGTSGSPDPFSKAISTVAGFLSSIVTKNDFFKARDQVTADMFNEFTKYFGLDGKKMNDYYWRRISNPGTNEKKIVDEWWKYLNDECIGEAAVSPCSDDYLHENFISTKNISGHWKNALTKLQNASQFFLSKYFTLSTSGNQAQQELINNIYLDRQGQNQSPPAGNSAYASTSGSWSEIVKKFNSLSKQQKIVVTGALGVGGVFLTVAIIKSLTS